MEGPFHVVLHEAWCRLGLIDPARQGPNELVFFDGTGAISVNPMGNMEWFHGNMWT